MGTIIWIVFIPSQKKTSLNLKTKYIKVNLKIKIFMELFCQPKKDILQFNQYVKSDKIS